MDYIFRRAFGDPAFKVFLPPQVVKNTGVTESGNYYARPEVARILNNAVSQGLQNSALYRGARQITQVKEILSSLVYQLFMRLFLPSILAL